MNVFPSKENLSHWPHCGRLTNCASNMLDSETILSTTPFTSLFHPHLRNGSSEFLPNEVALLMMQLITDGKWVHLQLFFSIGSHFSSLVLFFFFFFFILYSYFRFQNVDYTKKNEKSSKQSDQNGELH
ncbi:hypothetical protein POVWA1_002770 [Plasmodium ovale wallikeri]|uniref:Uncharacterized protein n=1 Tax=Plasmodium ovale wallikeri TaxID=864142 RepID=A0A1A8YGD7_PLAOA|nr:hypothetical protein POVWA1_002770 [Plasmodium ovale wallikeri]